ncbi:MAG: tetratricopeptide repeat protein [Thermodesulfobacteriota bacterium]
MSRPRQRPDPLDRLTAEHAAFAQSRTGFYLPRPDLFVSLDRHAESRDPPLAILGESGIGKSALLANWATQYGRSHPSDLVIMHFVGSSPQAGDHVHIVKRILGEVGRAFGLPGSVPQSTAELRDLLPRWPASVPRDRKLILVLDGLHHLGDRDNARELTWLPSQFPANVRVFVSTLAGKTLNAVQSRGWPSVTIPPLSQAERTQFLEQYPGTQGLPLDADRTSRIVHAEATGNPLYLKIVLDELRAPGASADQEERLTHCLKVVSVPELHDCVLARVAQDCDRTRPDLVGDALSFLWASGRGLLDTELRDILGSEGRLLPAALWSSLRLALGELLVSRAGLWEFSHEEFRNAVGRRYLSTPDLRKAAHIVLARYFSQTKTGPRRIDELPWQLVEAGQWKALKRCLTHLSIFRGLNTDERRHELISYWVRLGENQDVTEAYREMATAFADTHPPDGELADLLNSIGYFLDLSGQGGGAESFYRLALDTYGQIEPTDDLRIAQVSNNLACLLDAQGQQAEAESLYRNALSIYLAQTDQSDPNAARTLHNLACLLDSMGREDEAQDLHDQALTITSELFGPTSLEAARISHDRGRVFHAKGALDAAETGFRSALDVRRQTLGLDHPETADTLSRLAALMTAKKDYPQAEQLLRELLESHERAQLPDRLSQAKILGALAQAVANQDRVHEAIDLYRRALEVEEELLGANHTESVALMHDLASSLIRSGQVDEGAQLCRKALEIREQVLGPDHPHTAAAQRYLAAVLFARGAFKEAEALLEQATRTFLNAFGKDHPDTVVCLKEKMRARMAGLAKPHAEAVGTTRDGTQTSAGPEVESRQERLQELLRSVDAAKAHYSQGQIADAELAARHALTLAEDALGEDHPDTAHIMGILASVLQSRGANDEAASLYMQALAIQERKLGPHNPEVARTLNDLGYTLVMVGELDRAEAMLQRAKDAYEKSTGLESPQACHTLVNLGNLLHAKGLREEGRGLLEMAVHFRARALGDAHEETLAARNVLGQALLASEEYEPAARVFFAQMESLQKASEETHPRAAAAMTNLALALIGLGQLDKAVPLLGGAVRIYARRLGPAHEETRKGYQLLSQLVKRVRVSHLDS